MCVKVFLADDADVMRKAIRSMLSNRDDISVVGEASDFYETIRKTAELHPDLIILDVNMPDRNRIAPTEVKSLLNGAKVLAITFGVDDRADGAEERCRSRQVVGQNGPRRPTHSGDSGTGTGGDYAAELVTQFLNAA